MMAATVNKSPWVSLLVCLLAVTASQGSSESTSTATHGTETSTELRTTTAVPEAEEGTNFTVTTAVPEAEEGSNFTVTTANPEAEDWSLRLMNGDGSYGRVEVFDNQTGEWGTVCDDSWDDNDATVVCRQFNFERGGAVRNAGFGQGNGPIHVDDVHCWGYEYNLAQCNHSGWLEHNCVHGEDAGVVCVNGSEYNSTGYPQGTTPSTYFPNTKSYSYSDWSLRLMNGNESSGRVEVFDNQTGEWGTVCDDLWDDYDATVVCRQFYFDWGIAVRNAGFGQGNGPILVDDVHCLGDEYNLAQCDHSRWNTIPEHNCVHEEDAGVICYNGTRHNSTSSAEYWSVRLINGSQSSGRVEVFDNQTGEWGTVCDFNWDGNDATVVCRQLSFEWGIALHNAAFGPGDGPIHLDDVKCSSFETNLAQCRHKGWLKHDCSHGEDAGVVCYNESRTTPAPTYYPDTSYRYQDWSVRLMNGNESSGRVEVFDNQTGEWGTVCDDLWDDKDATLLCRQLFFDWGLAVRNAGFGPGNGPILVDNVNCFGEETSIALCDRSGWLEHDCVHEEDAGVICYNGTKRSSTDEYWPVRLMDGNNTAGRVEVFDNQTGEWGTVCDVFWNDYDATVVCQQLGFYRGIALHNATFGPGDGPIFLERVKCMGSERSLSECKHLGWRKADCGHEEDAGVSCFNGNNDGVWQVRLVGGNNVSSGRVEVRNSFSFAWGTVCDDGWGTSDANVVCRMLGFDRGQAYSNAYFGQGSGDILMDDVACTGWEATLQECRHTGWSSHNCGHSEDAGVACFYGYQSTNNPGWTTLPSTYYPETAPYPYPEWSVRLMNGNDTAGRVEVFDNQTGEWGTVCDDLWDDYDATVVCRQFYFDWGLAVRNAGFGQGNGPILVDDVHCWGYEYNLAQCEHLGWLEHNCVHEEDAGVVCYNGSRISSTYSAEYWPVRLMNGNESSGRVEVFDNQTGEWGTVCDDSWDDTDATVVCQQLGFDIGIALHNAAFGPGDGPIFLDNVTCSGRARNLAECRHLGWLKADCGHEEDAGVSCFNHSNDGFWQVRLVSGNNVSSGRVEVRNSFSSDWGTVCDDGWGTNDANVVCRMLGFDRGQAYSNAYFGQGSGDIKLDRVACSGWESSLQYCGHSGWSSHNCGHSEDAGVACFYGTTLPSTYYPESTPYPYPEWSVRLMNGNDSSGRVEVFDNQTGEWGTVCDDLWDDNDATVVCRQFYFDWGLAVRNAGFGQGNGPILIDDVHCWGYEYNLAQCENSGWLEHNCVHEEDAGVVCYNGTSRISSTYSAEYWPVRLMNGNVTAGRVEVFDNQTGEWGTVCDDLWDDYDATVVCQQLGFDFGIALHNAAFGPGDGPIFLDNVNCSGRARNLAECRHLGWRKADCGHEEDAGVSCFNRSNGVWQVRLVGGNNVSSGRVEVRNSFSSNWGTVCDDGWGTSDANLVCRMLGFDRGQAYSNAYFGQGSGDILLDDVACSGSEATLQECRHSGWNSHNCGHHEDAGVACFYDEGVWQVQLVAGSDPSQGRVEVRNSSRNQWGTVCDDEWGTNDANVVCRMLGYDRGRAYSNAYFGQGSGDILLDNVACTGSESSLRYCGHTGWSSHNCGHHEDAGVACFYEVESSTPSSTGWQVRLVGGSTSSSGRVEVRRDSSSSWGTVCDDSWDHNDATVVCRMFGYERGTAYSRAHFGQGTGAIVLDNVACSGTETSLRYCGNQGWGSHNCRHTEDAGVACFNGAGLPSTTPSPIENWSIRLVGGSTSSSGRVEVRRDTSSSWGTVCDDSWGDADADVACRMLGYSRGQAHGYAYFGQGSGSIFLDDVSCSGSETSLRYCRHRGWGLHNCGHSEDAGVTCFTGTETTASPSSGWEVRLEGGSSSSEGRVEVRRDSSSSWGTVCDDSWDHNDATVVCRMFGYERGTAYSRAHFGQGTGAIVLDNVACSGAETSLQYCGNQGWGSHNCGHYEDAGVVCSNGLPTTPSPSVWEVQLVGGNSSAGTVEVRNSSRYQWGTVCDDSWGTSDANVVCRMLGFDRGQAYSRAYFGQGTGYIVLDDMACVGFEASLQYCGHRGWGSHNCQHSEDAGVACFLETSTTSSPITDWQIQLVGGSDSSQGRVEVRNSSSYQWGTVCDDGWGTNDAYVVCRMLGYDRGQAYSSAYFGQGSGDILLDDVACSGSESSLRYCGHSGWSSHNCGHNEDAGVACFYYGNTTSFSSGTTLRSLSSTTSASPTTTETTPGSDWQIQLVGGKNSSQGRVEVRNSSRYQWGTVCDDGWGTNDANVVCGMLGYDRGVAYGSASFGQGSGEIVLDDVSCSGSESSLRYCGHSGWSSHNCGHSEDAGVACYNDQTTTGWQIQLVGGSDPSQGRVEVRNSSSYQWGTVCDDGWGTSDAYVVCRMLGFDGGQPFGSAHFGQGSGEIVLDEVSCSGSESSLRHCGHSGWSSHNCGHSEDAGVACYYGTSPTTTVSPSGPALRLAGGTDSSGRVEFSMDGSSPWWTVCDDSWDFMDATVTCHMLGYNWGEAEGEASFGAGTGPIFPHNINCTGSEISLLDCPWSADFENTCTHSEDAGVTCRDVSVRLMGGTPKSGRVELRWNDTSPWGTVCDNGWEDEDAKVVCRMLGYTGGVAFSEAFFGQGTGDTYLDNVDCSGLEISLSACPFSGPEDGGCDHSQDAGVTCTDTTEV